MRFDWAAEYICLNAINSALSPLLPQREMGSTLRSKSSCTTTRGERAAARRNTAAKATVADADKAWRGDSGRSTEAPSNTVRSGRLVASKEAAARTHAVLLFWSLQQPPTELQAARAERRG
jgi:hypothetical protein